LIDADAASPPLFNHSLVQSGLYKLQEFERFMKASGALEATVTTSTASVLTGAPVATAWRLAHSALAEWLPKFHSYIAADYSFRQTGTILMEEIPVCVVSSMA
jgi:hypothetical protein